MGRAPGPRRTGRRPPPPESPFLEPPSPPAGPARSALVTTHSMSSYWAPVLSGQGPGPAGVRGAVLCPGCGPSPGEGGKERDAERAGQRLRGPPARATESPPFLTPRVHENNSQKLPTTSYLLKVLFRVVRDVTSGLLFVFFKSGCFLGLSQGCVTEFFLCSGPEIPPRGQIPCG